MSLNTLSGGSFQDLSGKVLASGYLTFELSHDSQDTTTNAQICAGLTKKIPLDNLGSVAGGPSIENNDTLNPSGSYYIVNAYRSDGVRAWQSAQYVTVVSTSNPFNLGTNLIPASPAGGSNPSVSVVSGLQLGNTLWIPGSAATTDFVNIGDFMVGADNGANVTFPTATSTTNYALSLVGNRWHTGLPMFYAGRNTTLKATAQLTTSDTHTQAAIGLFSSTAWISLGSGLASVPTGSFAAFNVPNSNSGTWHAITSGGSSTTDVDTLVAYSAQNILEIDYTPSSVVFKINNAVVATITSNLPTTAAMAILWYSNHISGAANQTLVTEYISCTSATV